MVRCPIMRKNRTSRARRGDPMPDNEKESDIPRTITKKEEAGTKPNSKVKIGASLPKLGKLAPIFLSSYGGF
ncbi:hypothetical protein B0533_09300 [Sedimentibacter sp. SX930]|nr:hypothetical protein B0533_09300 [Sedimentibacter sp. SX930]